MKVPHLDREAPLSHIMAVPPPYLPWKMITMLENKMEITMRAMVSTRSQQLMRNHRGAFIDWNKRKALFFSKNIFLVDKYFEHKPVQIDL